MRDSNGNFYCHTDGRGISKPSRAQRPRWSTPSVSVRSCWFNFFAKAETLLVPQHFLQGLVNSDSAVVVNESLFPESVHEEIDSRAGSADHLRQNLVTYRGK